MSHVFKSRYPDVTIPDNVSLPQFVLSKALQHGDKIAFRDGSTDGRTLTFKQVYGMSYKLAAGLHARGFKKGDVFCCWAPNIPEYPVVLYAVTMLGGILTTAHPLYTTNELAHQLKDSGASYLLTIPPLVDKAKEAASHVNLNPDNIFVFGQAEGAHPITSLLNNDGKVPEVEIDPKNDVAVLPYSSGTTGLPKGVQLTHYNIVSNLCQCLETEGKSVKGDDKLIGVLPFFHIYGMTVIMCFAVCQGCECVVMSRFDLERFLQLVQEHKITYCHLVPPIIIALAKHPIVAKYDISSIRSIVSGAAPLGAQVQEELSNKLTGLKLRQGYGMTELSPVSHVCPMDEIVFGSAGVLVPNTEAKIVDTTTGKEVGVGEVGELWIRGPQVMKGYWNNEKATKDTLDSDGFLHTGDIGYIDERGHLFIVDRLKELIKYNGFQVPPAELEAVLLSHPAIADAAVIGVPDESAGELPKAYVVLKPDQSVTAEEIVEWAAAKVAPTKKLRGGVEFIDAIPKTASGKILRRVLKDKELAKTVAN